MVLPLDTGLLAPGIRGHFTLRPDPPGQALWWCVRFGMSWRAAHAAPTCPDGCVPIAGTPLRGRQSWLRHRQLVIGKRSPEYQALRSAGLAGAGTTTPGIDHPCPGREWGRRYHAGGGDTTSTDGRPLTSPCLPPLFPRARGRAHGPTCGADPAPPAWTTQPPAEAPHYCPVGTWRPNQAHRPRTGERRTTQ